MSGIKRACVIVNLGAPSAPDTEAAQSFLFEFLSDRCVLSIPNPFRKLLAWRIAKKRSAAYAESVAALQSDGKHMLVSYTEKLAEKLGKKLPFPVRCAFRYGKYRPLGQTLLALKGAGIEEIAVLAMYPQNALSTSQSLLRELEKYKKLFSRIEFVGEYFENPKYIDALCESVAAENTDNMDALVVSFHSVPVGHLKNSPYRTQCERTFKLLSERLAGTFSEYRISWQSKMGRGEWLEPSTAQTVADLAKAGFKKISVICPGFSCDCSETKIEIERDCAGIFVENGGNSLKLVPCLNDGQTSVFLKILEDLKWI